MTLFALLIVMAIERVSTKTKDLHISTWMQALFIRIDKSRFFSASSSMLNTIVVAAVLALPFYLLLLVMPGIIIFFLHLLMLWACLGCPITRRTYKQYLQAANREDFEACSLYSESFGNQGGDLSNVGKQLVLVNYRQYASVIIFYVLLGLPGLVFYCACKEIVSLRKAEQEDFLSKQAIELSGEQNEDSQTGIENQAPSQTSMQASEKILFVLDFIPVRITSFGYLLVGNFGNGLPIWLDGLFNTKLSAYDFLAKVAKASEEQSKSDNPYLDEPLQLVKLVKRNTVFLLMMISFLTLVGVVA